MKYNKAWLLVFCLLFLNLACAATQQPQRGLPEASKIGMGTDVAVMDGALIAQEMESPTPANTIQSQDEMIVVQCPACNQRVDVTGLPKERIRCPNCNSLFTY